MPDSPDAPLPEGMCMTHIPLPDVLSDEASPRHADLIALYAKALPRRPFMTGRWPED